ncbi:hypothetical protein [Prevotella sp. AGR2160]|uniref:hypothetical protein n=1 Tax=Prevotella sp. AGR2160 TaxID=1280674 RepID=UPI00041E413A|nr:hypothetical protein [Prevotella sp. AGR2160]
MKHFVTAALLALGATAAFAGDSDQLKAILKAGSYAETEQLINQNLNQLAGNEEKAKAYNHLMELAMKKYNKESTIVTQNQMNDQLKQSDKNQPYDTLGMYNAVVDALNAGMKCYEFDNLPNAKGKIKPKYDNNATTLWAARIQLVNGGQSAAQKGQNDNVLKWWGKFLDTEDAPIFKGQNHATEKDYLGQVALFTARYAYQAKRMDLCDKYCDMAMKDSTQAKDALNLKLYSMKNDLKNHADSLAYVEKLKGLYAQDPANEVILDNLNGMYASLKMDKEELALLDDAIAKNPNNFVALADKGMYYVSKNDADKAIKCLQAALKVKPDNVLVMTYLGACLNVKAANLQDPNGRKVVYTEALKWLDKAKQLDPEKQQANWGYNRYQTCYGLYGANDQRTKDAEAESH